MKSQLLLACLGLLAVQFRSEGSVSKSDVPEASLDSNLAKLLPEKDRAQEAAKNTNGAIKLYVTVSGELMFNEKKVSERELVRRLEDSVFKNKNVRVKVRSHSLTRIELTKRAMELCEGSGVWNLSWESEK